MSLGMMDTVMTTVRCGRANALALINSGNYSIRGSYSFNVTTALSNTLSHLASSLP
jgi:hypothetical protein